MRTTKKHFKIFKEEAEKWIANFGLLDWDAQVEHGNVQNDMNAAECQYNTSAREAVIRLSKDFTISNHFTDKDVQEAAFHEVAELLLANLSSLAERRYVTQTELEAARHSVIARLLNYFYRRS